MTDPKFTSTAFRLTWRNDYCGNTGWVIFVGGIYSGFVQPLDLRRPELWRAWVSAGENGRVVGYYNTESEAKEALHAAVLQALVQ